MEAAKCVTSGHQETTEINTRWSKFSVHLTIRVQTQRIPTIPTKFISWRWLSQNTIRMWTVLYWTRSSRTHFGVSINVWRLAGDKLNITWNFMYCKHQVHREFVITLYINNRSLEILVGSNTSKPRYNVTTLITHTTHRTETTSNTLSRFTAAKCSEQTVNNLNPPFIMYEVGD